MLVSFFGNSLNYPVGGSENGEGELARSDLKAPRS